MGTSWLAAGWARPRPAAISAKLKVVLITCHKLTNNIWSEHYRPSPAVSPVVLVAAFSTNNDSPVPQYLCPPTVSTLVSSCPVSPVLAGCALPTKGSHICRCRPGIAGCCCWCLVAADESWAMLEWAGVAQWAVVVVAAGWAQLGWADQYSATARQSVYTWL